MRASVGPTAEKLNEAFVNNGNVIRSNLPDTVYDYTQPWWNNANDRVAYERAFIEGNFEERQIAQALITANPATENAEIALKMTAFVVPDRFGYDREPLTISEIVDNELGRPMNLDTTHATDFSGRRSNIDATERPGLFW